MITDDQANTLFLGTASLFLVRKVWLSFVWKLDMGCDIDFAT